MGLLMLSNEQHEFLKSILTRSRLRKGIPARTTPTFNRVVDEQRSGAGPDVRDPAQLSRLVDHLIVTKGWDLNITAGKLHAIWPQLAGEQVADHVQIETLNLDPSGTSGVLILRADSTAWATQMRLYIPKILQTLADEFGPGVVTDIQVLGPSAPSWKHGLRSVPGRGPRDTYG